MNDKQQPDTGAQELDDRNLDQAAGAANCPTASKPPVKTGNKVWQDDWLDPK